ncbi:Fatty acid desaturase [Nesidiocoris tenuis]|uniref:Fatty acid desaturase n=1 Tax=Nesidiocoris tenuis TaxID=355587 RepID=A0ABN7AH69_9HEMI|nr:Fatty acid desaturase [Nesidiocoris tenuis]
MAPYQAFSKRSAATKSSITDSTDCKIDDKQDERKFKAQWKYPDLLAQVYIHVAGVYGLYLAVTSASILTSIWCVTMIYTSGFGITAGVHRLWSHRSFKAKLPLRILLAFLFTITGQKDIYTWALDHRVHHKYSETDSDPHDANRGFLFSHVGWLVLTPHPNVECKRAQIPMDDLKADAVVMWQKRLLVPLFAIFCIAFPVSVPCYFWSESLLNSLFISFNLRFAATLNIAYCVNSFAHMYGNKPFDRHISPTENIGVALTALGEGWHNYHHVFPWDYKTSEFGQKFNPTTHFINFMAKLGLAYDLKSVPTSIVANRAKRTGDGTWGFGDSDVEPTLIETS